MERWQGKVAVVTGASVGIGEAIAKKLVEEGITVVGLARRKELIDELAATVSGKNGSKLYGVRADMTNEEDIVNAFKWVTDNLGPVHVLINNAGVARNTTLIDGDTNKWRQVLDTNILGLSIATKEAVNIMQANNVEGHVVNINSTSGHYVPNIPFLNVYAASKHAVTALTDTLRFELLTQRSKIKVSSISPGFVETDIVNAFIDNPPILELAKQAPRMYPIDIANAVVYVLGTPPHVQVSELVIRPLGEPV